MVLDPDGRVTRWSDQARSVTGWSEGDVIGRHHLFLYRPEDTIRRHPLLDLEEAASSGAWARRAWRLRRSGQPFPALVATVPLADGWDQPMGFCTVIEDLSGTGLDTASGPRDPRLRSLVQAAVSLGYLAMLEVSSDHDLCQALQNATLPMMGAHWLTQRQGTPGLRR